MTDSYDESQKQSEGPRSADRALAGHSPSENSAKGESLIRYQLGRQIDQLKREIESLQKRARNAKQRSRQEYLELVEAVERRVTRLRWRLMRARGEASQSWQAVWAGAEASLKGLRTSVARMSAALRQEQRDNDRESEESSPPE
jgi:predicted RNase H-like nuclease (RuvC/YqgF family)